MEIIEKYFPSLSALQYERFKKMERLYSLWNQRINVVSRHILHSLAIAKYIRFMPGSRILDVGTGGGFPGIPLAILFSDVNFVLADSIAKKIKVVEAVCNELNLGNCKALRFHCQQGGYHLTHTYSMDFKSCFSNLKAFACKWNSGIKRR